VHLRAHRFRDALPHFEQVLGIARELGEFRWEARALFNLAEGLIGLDDLPGGIRLLEHALPDEPGNMELTLERLRCLAIVERELGHFGAALDLLQRACLASRASHNRVREGFTLLEVGKTQQAAGNFAQALASYQLSADIHQAIGDRSREARALDGVGQACQAMDRFDEAVRLHRGAVATHRDLDQHWWLAIALDNLATALCCTGATDEARSHWQEALLLFAEFDDHKAVGIHRRISSNLEARPHRHP
jgi:tetratricopeptide (TPR) repeat protein